MRITNLCNLMVIPYIKFGGLSTDIRTVELYVNNQIEGNESSLDFYKKSNWNIIRHNIMVRLPL